MQPNRTEKATQRGHRNQCRQWIFERIRKTREKEQCKQGTSTYRRKTFFPTYQSHNNTYKTNQQHTWSGYTVIHPQERKLIKRMAYLVGQPCVPTFRMTSKITPLYPHVFPAKASGAMSRPRFPGYEFPTAPQNEHPTARGIRLMVPNKKQCGQTDNNHTSIFQPGTNLLLHTKHNEGIEQKAQQTCTRPGQQHT